MWDPEKGHVFSCGRACGQPGAAAALSPARAPRAARAGTRSMCGAPRSRPALLPPWSLPALLPPPSGRPCCPRGPCQPGSPPRTLPALLSPRSRRSPRPAERWVRSAAGRSVASGSTWVSPAHTACLPRAQLVKGQWRDCKLPRWSRVGYSSTVQQTYGAQLRWLRLG